MKVGILEVVLVEAIVLSIAYLLDSYTGFLLSLIVIFISGAILVISMLAELVERSKVPRSYFMMLFAICVTALVVMTFFSLFQQGSFAWLNS